MPNGLGSDPQMDALLHRSRTAIERSQKLIAWTRELKRQTDLLTGKEDGRSDGRSFSETNIRAPKDGSRREKRRLSE
jgi:hypothetical protein